MTDVMVCTDLAVDSTSGDVRVLMTVHSNCAYHVHAMHRFRDNMPKRAVLYWQNIQLKNFWTLCVSKYGEEFNRLGSLGDVQNQVMCNLKYLCYQTFFAAFTRHFPELPDLQVSLHSLHTLLGMYGVDLVRTLEQYTQFARDIAQQWYVVDSLVLESETWIAILQCIRIVVCFEKRSMRGACTALVKRVGRNHGILHGTLLGIPESTFKAVIELMHYQGVDIFLRAVADGVKERALLKCETLVADTTLTSADHAQHTEMWNALLAVATRARAFGRV